MPNSLQQAGQSVMANNSIVEGHKFISYFRYCVVILQFVIACVCLSVILEKRKLYMKQIFLTE